MKKTRFLSITLCLILVLSSLTFTVSALTFSDVDDDSTVSWAKDSIYKMTDAGYIKGYEDGTFRPYKDITKIEALILMARMLGFEDDEYADIVDAAADVYGGVASKYNQKYTNEIAYLLFNGVLKESDLADYASATQANTSLLRYNAAMLMAKLIGKDSEAKAYTVQNATYADNANIPASAKAYVEFITKEGIMNGMDKAENGEPQFSPLTTLTRAQMATLLARLMDRMETGSVEGTIEKVNADSIVVDGDEFEILSSTTVYIDGEKASVDDLSEGDTVVAIAACDGVYSVIAEESQDVEITYGVVVRKSENSDGKKITVADYEDKDTNATYTLKNNCTFKKGSTKATFADIMADDFIKLEITGGKVTAISTEETKLDITGKLVSVEYDNEDHVYLNISDKDGDNVQNYVVSTKGAVVSRDGEDVGFRDLSSGDSVTVRLTYGKVTRVTAVSSSEKFSGILSEIILSNTPSITIKSNGESKTYRLRSDVKITIAGSTGDIYDLRPNITVSGTLDSSEVKTLTASTVAINEEGEFVGKVTGKNTTYNVITVEDSDGNEQTVYYNSKTTFLTRTGTSTTVKSIENGASVSIVGAEKNGVFEATIIILK